MKYDRVVRRIVEHLVVEGLHQLLDVLLDVIQDAIHAWAPRLEIRRDLRERGHSRIELRLDGDVVAGLQRGGRWPSAKEASREARRCSTDADTGSVSRDSMLAKCRSSLVAWVEMEDSRVAKRESTKPVRSAKARSSRRRSNASKRALIASRMCFKEGSMAPRARFSRV